VARRRYRQHSRDFKLAALALMDTAPDVQALAHELDIERALLYRWQRFYIRGGAAALRNSGRPRPVLLRPSEAAEPAEPTPARAINPISPLSGEEPPASPAMVPPPSAPPASLAAHDVAVAARRIAELERKIGQQQLELDFFRAALRHVRELRR
jgi:transposase-like protein